MKLEAIWRLSPYAPHTNARFKREKKGASQLFEHSFRSFLLGCVFNSGPAHYCPSLLSPSTRGPAEHDPCHVGYYRLLRARNNPLSHSNNGIQKNLASGSFISASSSFPSSMSMCSNSGNFLASSIWENRWSMTFDVKRKLFLQIFCHSGEKECVERERHLRGARGRKRRNKFISPSSCESLTLRRTRRSPTSVGFSSLYVRWCCVNDVGFRG